LKRSGFKSTQFKQQMVAGARETAIVIVQTLQPPRRRRQELDWLKSPGRIGAAAGSR
jgi:hypothetical protein